MTDSVVNPFVLVGDTTAAACEGDFCVVPEDQGTVPVDRRAKPARS